MSAVAHACHAVGCSREIPPILLLCPAHWKLVPQAIRFRVFAAYRKGREVDKQPSLLWCIAADDAVRYVAKLEGREPTLSFARAYYPPGAMAARA